MTAEEKPEDPTGPVIRDKRRIDPETGEVRPRRAAEESGEVTDQVGNVEGRTDDPIYLAKVSELEEMVTERTADLQRLQAEYANYKKRVDRDRDVARQSGIEAVVTDLLPILDSIEGARSHDELDGGFKLVADDLERLASKYGVEVFGEVGEEFNPVIHEALLQMDHTEPVEVPTISAVMQRGVRIGDRMLRPARVGVAQP